MRGSLSSEGRHVANASVFRFYSVVSLKKSLLLDSFFFVAVFFRLVVAAAIKFLKPARENSEALWDR